MCAYEAFYAGAHARSDNYGGSRYELGPLLRSRCVREWMAGVRAQAASASLLDVGCGKGYFLRDMVAGMQAQGVPVRRAIGVDLLRSPDCVLGSLPVESDLVLANIDGRSLPFGDASFDFVACNHVLEHVFETEVLLREIHRTLRPSGIAVVSVPNLAAWINRVLLLFAGQPLGAETGTDSISYGLWPKGLQSRLDGYKPAGHIRAFTPRALSDICESCGLMVKAWWNQSVWPLFPLTRWAGRNMGVIVRRR